MPALAGAQEPLTLRRAIDEALDRNPAVAASKAGVDEASARVRQARSAFLPRVDLLESWQRGNQPVFVFGSLLAQQRFTEANFAIDALNRPDAISNHHTAIVLEQTIWDGSRSAAALSASRIGAEMADQETRRAALDIYRQTVAAFGRAISAAAHLETAVATVESATEDLRRSEERQKAGAETEATVLAFRVELADAEVRRLRAASDAENARAALNVTIGAPIDDRRPLVVEKTGGTEKTEIRNTEERSNGELSVASDSSVSTDPARNTFSVAPLLRVPYSPQLEETALENRPEARQARLRVRAAEQEKRQARASFFPHIAFQAALDSNGDAFADRATTWTTGVQVRWNLFAGGGDAARRSAAAAAVARATAQQRQTDDQIRLEVREAATAHASAVARRNTARAMVDHATESRRMVRERYAAGLAPAVEVMRAAELVTRAQAVDVDALVDVQVTAAALDRAIGRLGKTP